MTRLRYTVIRAACYGLFFTGIFGCQNKFDYTATMQNELAKEERNDHLFLKIDFGMMSSDFFDYCLQLNKQQKIGEGPGNRSVQYSLEEFDHEVYMLFYPKFADDKIVEMPVLFAYKKWSPWNKDLFSNKLIVRIKDVLENWYGDKFYLLKDKNGKPGYVQIKGNRLVTITIKDDQYVKADMIDMSQVQNPYAPLEYKPN